MIIGLIIVIIMIASVFFFVSTDITSLNEESESGNISEIGIDYNVEETGNNQYVITFSEKVDEIRVYTEGSEDPVSRENSSSAQLNTESQAELKVFEDGEEYDVETIG